MLARVLLEATVRVECLQWNVEVKAAAARLAAAEGLLAAMGSAEDDVDDEEHPSVYWRGRRDAAAEAVAGVPEAEAPAGASFV